MLTVLHIGKMRPNIDFAECLKDSPKFRASLEEAESDIDVLESKLEKLVKACNTMIDNGKTFANANEVFINNVKDLALYFKDDDLVTVTLAKFTHTMAELQKYNTILLDQAHRSICKNLNMFIKSDIKKVKETRKHFEKISDDMDNAYIKNAQALKSKPQECEEAANVITAMKSCFAHTSLDYVFQINLLHSKKRNDVLHTMLSYMHAQNAFFHQGFDLFTDLEPYMKSLAGQLDELGAKAAAEKREMEERHTLVQQKEALLSSPKSNSSKDVKMEGYLFRRTSKGFKTWVRRWFMIQNNQLVYRKRSKDTLTVMEEDLRLCTVKPVVEVDRRFCFEVVSPARSHILQADSDQECQQWITAVQTGVTDAYRASSGSILETFVPPSDQSSSDSQSTASADAAIEPSNQNKKLELTKPNRMRLLMSIPGNDKCCDCGSPDPRWTSINLGITLCIECSGIHRSLGVHISKVKSITLDDWEPELLKVMTELGNKVVNNVYEAEVGEKVPRATPQCNRNVREEWIKAKYVQKLFLKKLPLADKGANTSPSACKRRWSVSRRTRKSPSRKIPHKISDSSSVEGMKPGLAVEDPKLVTGGSKDSGLSVSAHSVEDVIIFGANNVNNEAINSDLNLDSSDESSLEGDADTKSTTSLEDFTKLHPDMLLYRAAQARNLSVMLEALAHGANPNWANEDENGMNPLMKAVECGSLAACECLMLNSAKVDRKDNDGRTALHHATIKGHTAQVCQLLKRGANQHAVDAEGLDALTIAMNEANADIVTLLRLAKLNEEMKETEGLFGNPGDDTFTDVFRDFTSMASDNPEMLYRSKSIPEES